MKGIISWFTKKNTNMANTSQYVDVTRAADITLNKYSKTFKDLALYDKKETNSAH